MSGFLEREDIRRLRPAETAPFSGPIPTQVVSSDEYFPEPQTKRQRQVETKLKALGTELARKHGMSRRAFFATALLRILGGASDVESVLVRGNEARITFREHAVPRMKGISAAFHEVQFQAEVRRAHPLSLKLTRLGGAEMLDGLVRALTTLRPT